MLLRPVVIKCCYSRWGAVVPSSSRSSIPIIEDLIAEKLNIDDRSLAWFIPDFFIVDCKIDSASHLFWTYTAISSWRYRDGESVETKPETGRAIRTGGRISLYRSRAKGADDGERAETVQS
jgi:hypothetical protein